MPKLGKSKPNRDEVEHSCPHCEGPMALVSEDEKSLTLSCHGWNYQVFGNKARLWRTSHVYGAAQAHDWEPGSGQPEAKKELIAPRF